MAIADIARIRALASEPPVQQTITVPEWGDFILENLSVGEKFALQQLITKAEGRFDLDSATYLLLHTVAAPSFTAEDVALIWPHKDLGNGLMTLLDAVTEKLKLQAQTEAATVEAAKAGFPVGDGAAVGPASDA